MRKGPRGGGRDRDRIIRHTIRTESEDFAKQVGLRIAEEAALSPDGLRHHRETYVAAMRAYNAGEVERPMRSASLPYLIRHSRSTPSTTRGRWKTRTFRPPPRTAPDDRSDGSGAEPTASENASRNVVALGAAER
jgi:hypothetical protein